MNRFTTIMEKDEKFDIIKKIKVELLGKTFVLNRSRITGKDYSEYRKKMLKGDVEEATQNFIIRCLEHPESYGVMELMRDDPLIYRCLSEAAKMLIDLENDFL